MRRIVLAVWLVGAAACNEPSPAAKQLGPVVDGTSPGGAATTDPGGQTNMGPSAEPNAQADPQNGPPGNVPLPVPQPASGTSDAGSLTQVMQDAGVDPHVTAQHDATTDPIEDAAPPDPSDAGSPIVEETDAAIGTGSCCSAQPTPGCSNAELQVCVCELLPTCCTEAWNEACALIVRQKRCQPGVRECVCGNEEGQWGQTACCEVDWTDVFCDDVAESRCGALPGCR